MTVAEILLTALTLPVTWAAVEWIRARAQEHTLDKDLAVHYWLLAKAHEEQKVLRSALPAALPVPSLDAFLQVYSLRLNGSDDAGWFRLMFDRDYNGLLLETKGSRPVPIEYEGSFPPLQACRQEWNSTAANRLMPARQDKAVVVARAVDPAFKSDFNKAAQGVTACLGRLGIPIVVRYQLPVAFVEDSVEVDPDTRCVTITRGCQVPPGSANLDAQEYFLDLFREGRLPLASEDEVLKYLMLLTAPLLRDLAPGQLGAYWFGGTSGSGKDFLAELAIAGWGALRADRRGPVSSCVEQVGSIRVM